MATAELLECGLTHAAICRRRHRGQLHRLYTGVWAVGHANPSAEGHLLAAVKACGEGAALSHRSAGELWGFVEGGDRCPEVTVRGSSTRVHPGIVVHRTTVLGPRDVSRFKGIAVTSPPRTLLDLAGVIDRRPLRQAVRRAQGLKRVNHRQLLEVIDRLGPRRGSRKLARIIAAGPAPTRTVLEDVVLDLLLASGFAHPDVNEPLIIDGRRLVPDFRWAEQRLVVEADGESWHDQRVAREDDAERQAILETHGEQVLRVTWDQVISRRPETLARIRAAGAPLAAECRLTPPIRK